MKNITTVVSAVVCSAFLTSAAFAADTTVTVSLWDQGAMALDGLGDMAPMGMAMEGAGMNMATMGVAVDVATVPAGNVTFEVTNSTFDTIHEMIIAPIVDTATPLPYDADLMKVNEDTAGALGEVSELDPGTSGSVTLDLEPGQYILFCNLPGHYSMGMWHVITVTE